MPRARPARAGGSAGTRGRPSAAARPAGCASRDRPCTRGAGRAQASVYRPAMPPRRVIGIDAGGTKLLGGVVDEDLVVHHRVHRNWRGADRGETLDVFVEAVEEVRAAAPDVDAVGFGIPSLVDQETGRSVWSNPLPLDDVPFRDLMSERLGLPVHVDNDSNLALLAEHRHGAARDTRHALLLA